MKASLSRRLFRTILTIGLVNVGLTLVAIEFIYEDVEDTILRKELAQERRYVEQRILEPSPQSWRSALLSAHFLPDGASTDELPAIFHNRPPPFSREVPDGDKTFLISVERTTSPPGVLYLAQDISLLEDREDEMQLGLTLLGLGILAIAATLARAGTRSVVAPLHALTRDLAGIHPGTRFARLDTRYEDKELADIASTLNQLLEALDAYVQREKSLVSLASHELRTPVAVISGALDVLEQRGSLGEADARTVGRIRRAANEMRTDVEALLKLARGTGGGEASAPVDLPAAVRSVIAELDDGAPGQAERVSCTVDAAAAWVQADPALVRMLLRNLIQNAIRHTADRVHIRIGAHGLSITDEGPGLPEHVHARLSGEGPQETVPENGLGLYIVRLICERLGWLLQIGAGDAGGAKIDVLFLPAARVDTAN